jgi:hypothetical protein
MAIGRTLIILGAVVIILGVLLMFGERVPIRLGRLPGDIVYHSSSRGGKNTTFYFPWVTCLVISVVLSIVFWLFGRR